MANSSNRKTTSKNTRSGSSKSGSSKTGKKKQAVKYTDDELLVINYIVIIGAAFLCIMLFLCNFGLIGDFGNAISKFMFALFGWSAYLFPVLLIIIAFLWISKQSDRRIGIKIFAFITMFLSLSLLFELSGGITADGIDYDIKALVERGATGRAGGGIISGSLAYFLNKHIDKLATILIGLMLIIISLFLICGKMIIEIFTEGREKIADVAKEADNYRTNLNDRRRKEREERVEEDNNLKAYEKRERAARLKAEEKAKNERKREEIETDNILRMEKKVSGVSLDTTLKEQHSQKRDDMHEIVFRERPAEVKKEVVRATDRSPYDDKGIRFHTADYDDGRTDELPIEKVEQTQQAKSEIKRTVAKQNIEGNIEPKPVYTNKKYKFPPLSLLSKGEKRSGSVSRSELGETAHKLEEALESFGVSARVTDVSQGPSVTRYELEPAIGVKVSRITALADDLKLHLAARDIRIEAPIPGKSAVGIEVPNAENSGVMLRELFEDPEFGNFSGNIAFAVGKDIAGKVIVADVSKMPHMLIAGSTGSGKSVCINTIIMSILYKHDPKDVQLIMVDPKVVELNVYNDIPHLMIPVVTDPKKAAGALHWAVNEMTDRYRKFADLNVRDLKGYNKKVAENEAGDESEHKHLPQIVIIVDELADLMMVAAKEVEEAICRLAQLARACGIHLILATQRPSVDVITGLIKANMPSRVAFAVSSGVDSRTILDMNGAEKLLGKGDMLFYPQGYTKPTRIQGAFVSDREVAAVVDFIKGQRLHNDFGAKVSEAVMSRTSNSNAEQGSSDNEYDDLFVQAGRFIIESDKASIGYLQRKFRIGFNRAARIMDQLCDAGVVGDEQGTKPREILMSEEQFEQYIEEYV